MKLIKVENVEFKKGMRKKTNIRIMIEEFVDSDMETCEIVFAEGEYKSANVCATTWNRAISRYGFVGVRVFRVGEHVYINKFDLDEK